MVNKLLMALFVMTILIGGIILTAITSLPGYVIGGLISGFMLICLAGDMGVWKGQTK